MTVPVTATTPATFTDLLALLFPTGMDGYVKLVAEGSQRQEEYWFRRSPEGTWLWQRSRAWREQPESLDLFLAAHATDLYFSPLAWSSPVLGVLGEPAAAGWASLRVGTLAPTARTVTLPRVDAAAAEQVRQRLSECSPPPSVILNEGDRVTGLWLLTEPLSTLAQLERINRALAARLGAKYEPPAEALLAVPGTRRTTFLPAPTVEIVTWEPERRYGLDELPVR